MASQFLSRSAPAEIIICILQSCRSTRDILAFILACRHIYNVWHTKAAAVLWSVWLRDVPCFEDAVIAARMTQLVIDAERQDQVPPSGISPSDLSGYRQEPNIRELRAAFALNRLSHALAVAICYEDLRLPADRRSSRLHYEVEDPAYMPEWDTRMRKAIYRTLIAGAALAGAYNEPLFTAKSIADPELQCLVRPQDGYLSEKQLMFLEEFAVCNMDSAPEDEESVFGLLGEWLLASILSDVEPRAAMAKRFDQRYGRARYCQNRSDPVCPLDLLEGSSHSDAHHVVWEVMKMLWAYHHVNAVVSRRSSYHTYSLPKESGDENNQGPLRKAFAVFFGVFRAEEVLLPERIISTQRPSLEAELAIHAHDKSAVAYVGDRFPSGMGVTVFFDWIRAESGRPNCIETTGDPVAPLTLKFFEYFLRHYTGLRFLDDAFHQDSPDGCWYEEFVHSLTIMSHDDVEHRKPYDPDQDLEVADFLDGSELLTSSEPSPTRFFAYRLG